MSVVPFTFDGYKNLIMQLRFHGYNFANYFSYEHYKRCVILRHDIDISPKQALKMAQFEHDLSITSTYFVLVTSDIYNLFSQNNREIFYEIVQLGHEIGLHFDETAYSSNLHLNNLVRREVAIIQEALGYKVRCISMHMPSAKTLLSDYKFPELVNSYGNTFFKEFKYLSDSNHHWREPVLDIIASQKFEKLHILTHPFWYHQSEISKLQTCKNLLNSSLVDEYQNLLTIVPDLNEMLPKEDYYE